MLRRSLTVAGRNLGRRTNKSGGHLNSNQKRSCGLLAAVDDVWRVPGTDAGSRNPSTAPILQSEDALTDATSKMIHRGPDGRHVARGFLNGDSGAAAAAAPQQQPRWAMGHQRLAIVDPLSRSADMPFLLSFGDGTSNKTDVKLAANGEIYNHEKLYDEILVAQHGWAEPRISHSDCEVIAHACACLGPEEAVKHLDGMFAFVLFEEGDTSTGKPAKAFAARDPVGIKPLYYGTTVDGNGYVFASELKALVGHVAPSSVQAIPPGHYWTPETGLVRYHHPEWLLSDTYAPWEAAAEATAATPPPTRDEVREAFKAAVSKRMMADVDYGFFLSGGVDSCIVSHTLLPMYREVTGDDRPIPAFTIGMEDSPDMMAARAMVDALGGEKHVDHRFRVFTGEEVFALIPKIIYHMETYEAELIRSAIPNWLLAERAGADVKMVLTGEGADELFAGYLYFMDADTPRQIQNELRRIYQMLGDINLHRTDRMTMAHSLEARVPFLDTEFTKLAMSIDPANKIVDREAVAANTDGREKSYLRNLFGEQNGNGHSIPGPVLWRAKAMQCEGVGEDWVSMLQAKVSAEVTDAELADAANLYPLHTPHTKEELYYRRIFEDHYAGMAHVVNPWEGGCRAAGAEWESDAYTREGLANTNYLTHAFQQKSQAAFSTQTASGKRSFSTTSTTAAAVSKRSMSTAVVETYTDREVFESALTSGGDDRNLINTETGTNKYHMTPSPLDASSIFRGSCTCNPPTQRGYDAAKKLFGEIHTNADTVGMDQALSDVFEQQRQRIAAALELPEGVEVILCPSGSDAEYLPIAMARALKPEQENIVNIVTQLKEVGAGTSVASAGEYFSDYAPLIGAIPDGKTRLQGFDEDKISMIAIPARERDGSVVDASKSAAEAASKAEQEGAYPIVHGVFGGKTGLRDAKMPGSKDSGRTSLGVVDACQARYSLEELHSWLEQDSIVLVTASKFYQAPPFCGAVLVPKRVAEELNKSPPPAPVNMLDPQGLGAFLTEKELPECLDTWKPFLSEKSGDVESSNVGLALRWEAGLAGMEALATTPDAERVVAADDWANRVTEMIGRQPELDAWCVERSIISIRLRKVGGANGEWLSMSELRDVYRYMSKDVSSAVPADATAEEKAALAVCCGLGQPVDVADSHAILRIALGSESLTSYLVDNDATLREDEAAVRKLAVVAKYFSALKQSDF